MPTPTLDEAALPLREYLRLRAAQGHGALLSPRGCELIAELMTACLAVRQAKLCEISAASLALAEAIEDLETERML